jgi:hypothetical protein
MSGPGGQWIGGDAILALQFWRRDEFLNTVETHSVAKLGVARRLPDHRPQGRRSSNPLDPS